MTALRYRAVVYVTLCIHYEIEYMIFMLAPNLQAAYLEKSHFNLPSSAELQLPVNTPERAVKLK